MVRENSVLDAPLDFEMLHRREKSRAKLIKLKAVLSVDEDGRGAFLEKRVEHRFEIPFRAVVEKVVLPPENPERVRNDKPPLKLAPFFDYAFRNKNVFPCVKIL